jgi:hypothetical protein
VYSLSVIHFKLAMEIASIFSDCTEIEFFFFLKSELVYESFFEIWKDKKWTNGQWNLSYQLNGNLKYHQMFQEFIDCNLDPVGFWNTLNYREKNRLYNRFKKSKRIEQKRSISDVGNDTNIRNKKKAKFN